MRLATQRLKLGLSRILTHFLQLHSVTVTPLDAGPHVGTPRTAPETPIRSKCLNTGSV